MLGYPPSDSFGGAMSFAGSVFTWNDSSHCNSTFSGDTRTIELTKPMINEINPYPVGQEGFNTAHPSHNFML